MSGIALVLAIGLFLYTGFNFLPVLFFIIFYVLQNIRRPIVISVLSNRIPASAMASGLSVESQAKTLLVAVLSPVLGFLMDKLGLGPTFLILAVFLAIMYPFIRLQNAKDLEK